MVKLTGSCEKANEGRDLLTTERLLTSQDGLCSMQLTINLTSRYMFQITLLVSWTQFGMESLICDLHDSDRSWRLSIGHTRNNFIVIDD
jgi:hypothetical protein